MYVNIVFLACLLVGVSWAAKNSTPRNDAANAIGFPEVEENPNSANKDKRKPIYVPAICPENELYYPGDQKDDWICDCRHSYIYHPPSDKCWPAFRKGPCAQGEYLILPTDSAIPVCQKNPCVVDEYVQWNGSCQRLGSNRPCEYMYPVSVLGVNATTLVISCVRVDVESRLGELRPTPLPVLCPSGSRRDVNGKC